MGFETSIYIGTVNYSMHYHTDGSVKYLEGDYYWQVVDVLCSVTKMPSKTVPVARHRPIQAICSESAYNRG